MTHIQNIIAPNHKVLRELYDDLPEIKSSDVRTPQQLAAFINQYDNKRIDVSDIIVYNGWTDLTESSNDICASEDFLVTFEQGVAVVKSIDNMSNAFDDMVADYWVEQEKENPLN